MGRKKSLRELNTPQQTKRAISLLEMFWARRLAIANLRYEEEGEWVGMRMMKGNC
jgi:hypothetical protein